MDQNLIPTYTTLKGVGHMLKKCSELGVNEGGIVKKIHLEEPKQFKLMHFGLLKNSKIICVGKSSLGSPIAYQINGCVFAMRTVDAEEIEVEV